MTDRIHQARSRGRESFTTRYVDERRRATLAQIRRLALGALMPITAAVSASWLAFSDHLPQRLTPGGIAAVACLGTYLLARRSWARRRAIALAVGFVTAIVTTALWWAWPLPLGLNVMVGAAAAMSAVMMAALVLPWGVVPQLGVTGLSAFGFFCLVVCTPLDLARSSNMLVAFLLGVLPSVVSAFLLDRQRRAAFAEDRGKEARARQQSVLAQLGKEALATSDIVSFMDEAVAVTANALDVEYTSVLELLPGNRGLVLRAGVGWGAGLVGEARVGADGDSQTGYTLASGDAVVAEDLRTETRFGLSPLFMDHGLVSSISVVIPDLDRPLGVLAAHATTVRKFTEDDVGFLRSVAIVIAAAVARKGMNRALTAVRSQLDRLLSSSPAIVYTAEASGGFGLTFISENTEAVLGYSRRELLELANPVHLVRAEDRPLLIAIGRRLAEDGAATVECSIRCKDGSYLPVYNQLRLHTDAAGRPSEVVGACLDISDRRKVEEEARQARHVAQAALRAKSEFLDNISHEIRTPMNAIFGMTDMLLDSPLSSEQRDYAETARRSAQSLFSMVEDILDFSNLEAGRTKLQMTAFCLREHFDDTLRMLIPAAFRKGLKVIMDVIPEIPDCVVGDPQRLRQILMKLIGNAIKFTEQGQITVRVAIEARGESNIVLLFSVADTGIGIESEKHREIFDAFVQADTSMTREYGGTGLGLAVSAQLVTMMGGRIWFESEVGKGSTFRFTVPLVLQSEARPATQTAPAPIGKAPTPLRILVAEDDAVNSMVVVRLLEKRGHTVAAVGDGEQALAALAARPFDVVLMDVQMPNLDGLEATVAIRARERGTSAHVPIVALTAHARKADQERCLQVGMDGCVAKPIQAADLFAAIEEVGSERSLEHSVSPSLERESRPEEATEPPEPSEREGASEPGILHRESLRSRFGDDPALLLDIVKVFQEDSRTLLEELRNGVTRRDSKVVEHAAHRLEGSLGTMAAISARDAAQRLEELGRAGDLDPAEQVLSDLERKLARLEPELAALTVDLAGSVDS